MRILIAEDDPVALKILQLTLEHFGHEVIAAKGGQEAWEIYDQEPVRVIISDWMMPDMDGLQLCRKVRGRPKTGYTYFILLTAINPGKDNYRKAIESGIDDFLSKPLDRDSVLMRLHVAKRILEFTTEIRQLKSLLPICMYCSKIRGDNDQWEQMETYIHNHTGSDFSHGMCPECYAKQMAAFSDQS